MEAIIMAPTILFLVFVAPIWIIMYYRSKRQAQASLTDHERGELRRLVAVVAAMRERVETLETILDDQTPDWRQRASLGEQN